MTLTNIEAREVRIAGHQLRCQVCDYTRFFRREARLTSGAASFGQDWANSKANCYVCEQCGYVHWFVPARTISAAPDTSLAAEIEDLRLRLEAEYAEDVEPARS